MMNLCTTSRIFEFSYQIFSHCYAVCHQPQTLTQGINQAIVILLVNSTSWVTTTNVINLTIHRQCRSSASRCFSLEAPSDLRHMRQGPARASLCITEFLGSHIPCEHPSVTLKVCAAHVPIVLVANAVATHTAVWLTRAAYVFFHWYNGYGNCIQMNSTPF